MVLLLLLLPVSYDTVKVQYDIFIYIIYHKRNTTRRYIIYRMILYSIKKTYGTVYMMISYDTDEIYLIMYRFIFYTLISLRIIPYCTVSYGMIKYIFYNNIIIYDTTDVHVHVHVQYVRYFKII